MTKHSLSKPNDAQTHKTLQKFFNYIDFKKIWKQFVSFFALLLVAYPIEKLIIPLIVSSYIITWKYGNSHSLFTSCSQLVIAYAIVTLLWTVLYYLSLNMQQHVGVDARQGMVKEIFKYYETSNKDIPLGKWLTHMEFVPYVVEITFYKLFCYLIPECIGLVVVAIYFSYVNVYLGIGTIIFICLCIIYFMCCVYGSQHLAKEEYEYQTVFNQKVHNMVDNLSYIQTSQASSFELNNFDTDCNSMYNKRSVFCTQNTKFLFGFDMLKICFFVFVCFWMYHLMTKKNVKPSTLVLYTSVFIILIAETRDIDYIIKQFTEIYNYTHKTSVFFDDNEIMNELKTTKQSQYNNINFNTKPSNKLSIAIQTHDLAYTHPEHNNPIFTHKSIAFAKHKVHAIVGSAGCGKTTFAKLLSGIHTQPSHGNILLYGQDTTTDVHTRRKTIMYLPQHIKLFEGSILDNIRYTHTSLTHDDVHQVLMRFDVSSILQQKHDVHNYLDRSVGVGGSQVSGGQKQVIILMRTCIDTFLQHSNTPKTEKSILVLDEPTASLDDDMVTVVMKLLQRMKHTHTILMITHNQHIAKQCDTITPFQSTS